MFWNGDRKNMKQGRLKNTAQRQTVSVKTIYHTVLAGTGLTIMSAAVLLYLRTGDSLALVCGILFTAAAFAWMAVLMQMTAKKLCLFTDHICETMDRMTAGGEVQDWGDDSETLLARISHRLMRLYEILQENRRRAFEEQQKLQMLVSDISHQVKTPVSNLRMVTDTLLTRPVTEQERMEFVQGISRETEKLDFLFQALIKTSRLESGSIRLEKTDGMLYDTLAQAMSGIVYHAEEKRIRVSVSCPEHLRLMHDRKWTAEALFNLLDNAVKYTPEGGSIDVTVEQWEMYVKIDISDTGKGIAESRQASVFRRFYREQEVHGEPGAGIGLYLTREIVTRQGGYVQVVSEVGKGSVFSVFLPWR